MNEIVFAKQDRACRGGRTSDMNIYSYEAFVKGVLRPCRNTIRLCYIDGESFAMRSVTLGMFEDIFSKEDITAMQANGLLDYYPDQIWIDAKYPMFQAPIYKKHGIQKS